jgi:tetratricopeptide (TPR) repeat protein
MSALRWPLAAVLLVAVAAVAAPRFWSGNNDEQLGTASPIAAEQYRNGSAELRRLGIDAAQKSLTAAIEADPEFAMAHFELGYTLIQLGQRDDGIAQIRLADSLAHDPGQTTELERLVIGMAASRLDENNARHEDYFDQLCRDYPDHPQTLRAQAQRALDDNDPERAEEFFRKVIRTDPDRVEIHNRLGYLALQQGRYEDAVASFKRYAYFATESANPHDSLGEAYLWTGRYHESIEQYREALQIDPSFLSSVVGATDALALTGQFRVARKFLENFGELFERRNQQAMREVKELQVDYMAENWEDVAARRQHLRDDEYAFSTMAPGLRLRVNTLGALALAELGRFSEADTLIATVEEEFDSLLVMIGKSNEETRGELQLLRSAIHCRMALLEGQTAAKQLAELRGLIEASTRQPHQLLPYQGVLVQGLFEAGLDAEVLDFAPQILSFNPRHPRTLLASARAEARLRNREAALGYLQRYLDVMRDADDTHPRVSQARQLLEHLSPSS